MKAKVASIQYWLSDEKDKAQRIREVEKLIDKAGEADLILLPEVWNIGWRSFDKYEEGAEKIDGETISRISDKAREVGAHILAGSIIEKQGDDLFNTAVLLDPAGEVRATYRKIHLYTKTFDGLSESKLVEPGREIVTVKTELGKIGLAICNDLRFPELYRKMAVQEGVEIFLTIAAWPLVRVENWVELSHVRANENQSYLISSNCAGFSRETRFLGHSAVVDPHGISVAQGGLSQCIVKSEIDLGKLRKFRKDVPHLRNRILSV